MNETDFFRGLENNDQNNESFLSGAEHLIRLRNQVGFFNNRDSDLELEKVSYEIQPSDRPDIPKSDFAQPNKTEAGHKGKYPITDRQHARSALGFAKMHHDQAALSAVRKEVEEKYPDMLSSEKNAGELSGLLASTSTPSLSSTDCPKCKKEKHACICKTAAVIGNIRNILKKNPTLRAATLGGVTSGTVGAAIGAATAPKDNHLKGAVKGGWTGAASGAGGGALYHQLNSKLAEMREKTAGSISDSLKNIDPKLLYSIGLGAILGGIGGHLSSRTTESGKSNMEEELENKVELQRKKPEGGLLDKLHRGNVELKHNYAKAFRQHPVGAKAVGALTGALGGYTIGRSAGALPFLRNK